MSLNHGWRVALDLEGTIIESFKSAVFLDHSKLRLISHWLKHRNIKEIDIFSFAMRTPSDQVHFDILLRGQIERFFNVTINDAPTIHEIYESDRSYTGVSFPFIDDWMRFRGKGDAWRNWCKAKYSNHYSQMTLIDDVVPTVMMSYRGKAENRHHIELLNIRDLPVTTPKAT